MDVSPFEGLYKKLSDEKVNAYLKRIGYTGKRDISLETLAELMKCQLDMVPFENLDIFHGHKEPQLDTDILFDKIVLNNRGGYCFELNGLFWRLLEALGYTCHCSMARIIMGREYLTPPAHRVIIVEIEGKEYFCDVGFGGPIPASPVEIKPDVVQTCAVGREYKFEFDGGIVTLLLRKDDGFMKIMSFERRKCDPVEFIPLNTFCACSYIEPFLKKQMVWKLSSSGRISVDGDILRKDVCGCTEEIKLDTEEKLHKALEENFGIKYRDKLREWRE